MDKFHAFASHQSDTQKSLPHFHVLRYHKKGAPPMTKDAPFPKRADIVL